MKHKYHTSENKWKPSYYYILSKLYTQTINNRIQVPVCIVQHHCPLQCLNNALGANKLFM